MSNAKPFVIATAAVALIAATAPSYAAELLINGSFEQLSPTVGDASGSGGAAYIGASSTQITGWVTQLSGVEVFTALDIGLGLDYPTTIADGVRAVDLTPVNYAGGGISQTFATTPGVTYDVSFFGGTATLLGKTGYGQILVTVDSAVKLFEFFNQESNWVWKQKEFQFTATGTSATLSFVSLQDASSHLASIDNVSVTAVPEPAAVGAAAGLGLLVFGVYRRLRA